VTHHVLAEKDVGGVDRRGGNRKQQAPRDLDSRPSDQEHETRKAGDQGDDMPPRDGAAQEQRAGDDHQARVDVHDQHAERSGQRLQSREVSQRLSGVDDRTEAEQREQALAFKAQGVLAHRQREPPHADRGEEESERERLRRAEAGGVRELGEDGVGAERRRRDEHHRHADPLGPAASGRADGLYGQRR